MEKRIYQRTEAGDRAAWLAGSGLPHPMLRLLRSLGEATTAEGSAALEDLEAIGLLESISVEWLARLVELGNYASCGSACCSCSPSCTCCETVS